MLAFSQKQKVVEKEHTYIAPEWMSVAEAKARAFMEAQTEALRDSFGTIIISNSYLDLSNLNGNSQTLFNQLGESEVKGEWLRDIEKRVLGISYTEHGTKVDVYIKGLAREIVSAPIDITVQILKNGKDSRFESDDFHGATATTPMKDRDYLYLSFRSPVDGYVAVYMLDGEGTAYCLLPYRDDGDGQQPVKAGHNYIFFAGDDGGDKIYTTLGENAKTSGVEFNHIYILFSPHPFRKSDTTDSRKQDGHLLAPQLPLKDFQRWFVQQRKHDKEMQVVRKTIKITKTQ